MTQHWGVEVAGDKWLKKRWLEDPRGGKGTHSCQVKPETSVAFEMEGGSLTVDVKGIVKCKPLKNEQSNCKWGKRLEGEKKSH